jgi:hypothetical protein
MEGKIRSLKTISSFIQDTSIEQSDCLLINQNPGYSSSRLFIIIIIIIIIII